MGDVKPGRSSIARLRHDARVARSFVRNLIELKRLRKGGKEIVVFCRIGRMGDLVQCEPMVRQIREEHPRAAIAHCVLPRFREVVESNPHVDRTLIVTCLCEARMLGRVAGVTRLVDAHPSDERWGDCRRTGAPSNGAEGADDFPRHANRLEAFQRIAGLTPRDDASRIYVTEHARRAVDALGLPPEFVAVHCRSMDAERNWSDEAWNELARALCHPVVEVGWGHAPAIRGGRDLCGKTGILEAAEVIRRSQLFIGVDSGPAHLANAVGTPGVILVGNHRRYPADRFATNRMYNGLYADGARATIVRCDSLVELEVSDVLEVVRERLDHGL